MTHLAGARHWSASDLIEAARREQLLAPRFPKAMPLVMNVPTRPQWISLAYSFLAVRLPHTPWCGLRVHGGIYVSPQMKRPGYLNAGRYGDPQWFLDRDCNSWPTATRVGRIGHVDHGKTVLTAAITFTSAGHQEIPMKKRTEMVPYSVQDLLSKDRPRRKPKPSRTKQQREARKVQRRNK